MRLAIALLVLSIVPAVAAQDPYPVIRDITFTGNDTTQPKIMLREMALKVGDGADPVRIERSRQAVLDLGLFNSVTVEQTPLDDGVRLTFTVREKWYIVPIPRYSVSSDGKDSYGLSLNWFNLWGLNHTLRGQWSDSDEKIANKGRSTSYRLGYSMPFVLDTPYNIGLGSGHSSTPITTGAGYTETFDSASVSLSRTFGTESTASQGWTVGSTVSWLNQDTEGEFAPARYGAATSLGVHGGYRDVRFKVYSEEGVSYGAAVHSATQGVVSDYAFNQLTANYSRLFAVGRIPHQSVHLRASAGSYHGGPQGVESEAGVFALGGASTLRGYPVERFKGDAFYYVTAEYLRPVRWNWLRLVAIAEVGNTFADAHSADFGRTYGSVGLGFRVRVIWFVNAEAEFGVAWPLGDGGSRFFASKV